MNDVTDITLAVGREELTMSSLELADLASKRHDNVVRDIRKMLAELNIPALKFEGCYKGDNGKDAVLFHLPKRECYILMSGYSTEMRAKIVDRWMELEGQRKQLTPAEALLEQVKLMVEVERRQLAIEARQKEQDVEIKRANDRLDQIETSCDHFTCVGYARWAKSMSIDLKTAAKLGQCATRRANQLGVKITKVPDPRFGAVSQYPKAILDVVWDECMGGLQ